MEEGEAVVSRISTIDCEHVILAISDYIEGEVDRALHDRIKAHLAECNHCMAIHDGTRNVLTLVADGNVLEVPAGFGTRLYSRLTSLLK